MKNFLVKCPRFLCIFIHNLRRLGHLKHLVLVRLSAQQLADPDHHFDGLVLVLAHRSHGGHFQLAGLATSELL